MRHSLPAATDKAAERAWASAQTADIDPAVDSVYGELVDTPP
ncbi:hypothetical protein [Actinacidiphila glaucinigra]